MAAYELSCNLILFFAKVYQSELNSMDDAASEIIQPGMTEENCFLETFEVLFISFTMQMYDPIIFFVVSVVRKMKMSTTACTWRMIRWQRKIFEYRVRNTIDYLVACVLNNSEGFFSILVICFSICTLGSCCTFDAVYTRKHSVLLLKTKMWVDIGTDAWKLFIMMIFKWFLGSHA